MNSQYSINVDWVVSLLANFQNLNEAYEVKKIDRVLPYDIVWEPPINLNLRLDVDAEVDFNKKIYSVWE